MASTNPPPTVLTGWQVIAPSGRTGELSSVTLSRSAPAMLSADEINAALSMVPPAAPPKTASFDVGLAPTLSAGSIDRIAELARALDYNWLNCYSFVRDNIRFVPYADIVRGPVRTLIDREGNSADQSFLLLSLLRASGYDATIFYDPYFHVPLTDSATGYDAANWLGISASGTPAEIQQRIFNILDRAGLHPAFDLGETPDESYVAFDHFFVGVALTAGSYTLLDPSFKPQRVNTPDPLLISAMGYNRSNLLAEAAGTVTNDWFVQNISTAGLTNELNRLTTNLTALLRSACSPSGVHGFPLRDAIIPQDLRVDSSFFHGYYTTETIVDFFSQPENYRDYFRGWIQVLHSEFSWWCWLDELGDRGLWLTYTNMPGYTYPRLALYLDGERVAYDTSNTGRLTDNIYINVKHPSVMSYVEADYLLQNAVTNIYAIPVGFGSTTPDGMRGVTAKKLVECNNTSPPEWHCQRSAMLHALGHHYLYQSSMINSLQSRIGGYTYNTFFDIGISGQEQTSFFDLRNGVGFISLEEKPSLYGERIFASALEHSVLDQNNSENQPAVSTVRLLEIANTQGIPIYQADSGNWASIRPSLINYGSYDIYMLNALIAQGQTLLLPQKGDITLNDWSGFGLFMYGPGGFGSLINGWLGGGEPSRPGVTSADKVLRGNARVLNEDGTVASTRSADPVDMRSGAAVIDRSDLAIKGATPLRWRRHYDSRQRFSNNASGRGWSHGYDSRITVHTDPDAFIGRDMPASAAASIVACTVVSDLVLTNTAKTLTTACLVTKWWTDQLLNNAATITADGSALSFCRLPDGSYEPQPGVTATLTGSAFSGFSLQERFGDIWRFTTNGVLASVEDRSGNRVSLSYTNGTSLVAVANDFGAQLNIDWSGDKITSVSDNAGRSLAYAYSPAGCLTSVTDVAGYTWAMRYNDEGNLLSETDPEGIVTVQNTYNALGQVTNQLSASGQRWQFAFADGWRSWESDPLHNQVNYGFTPGGRNSWREDRDGAYHQFFYDFFGHMVTNIDAVGREQLFVYDNDNHLLSVTEAANTPDARATSFAYNDGHHLIAITNALGRVTRMSYDNCDRLALLTTPDGVSVTNTYTAEGLLAASRALAPNGGTLRESSFVYNARGLPEAITATDAGTTTFSYDSAGNVTGIIDARSNPATITYDPRGFATNAVNALGHSAATLFSAAGRPLATTDPLGRTTAFQWTPGGNPAATIFADGAMLTNHYDAADRLVSVTDPRDATLTFNLDVAGRVTNRIAATWSDYTWYDLAGVVTTRQDAVSGRTDIASDWLDRPVAVTDPLNHTRHAYYDPLNAVTNTVDPRGRSTRHTYDVMGRLIRTTRPSGYAESYGHDLLGRTTSFTNAEGRITTQTFDAQDRLLSTVNAAGERLLLNRYDHLGNLTNRLDGADNSSVYEYDALNRNTSVTYADNTTETFAYDNVGNLTAADNGTVSNTFVYDIMDRLVGSEVRDQTSEVSFQTSYRYDIGGLITNIVYPGNKTLHYAYDTDGRLTSVTDWNSRTFTFTHDAAGRRTALTYPNGVSGAYTYDATHHLTSWQYAKGGSTLTGRAISRDAVGLKTGETVTAGRFPNPTQPRRMQNTFDAADRLTAAVVHSGTNTYNETYLYNANGALTNRVSLQSTVVSHHSAYTYDLAGRFSSYNSQFPIHNSQFSVCYDALGNRTKTVQDGTTRLWITDHADPLKRPLMETDADGEPVRYYIWGGGTLLAIIEADGTTYYAHSDELGSVVTLTDSAGAIIDQFSYGPYGENWGRTGTTDIPFRWLGSHGVFAATPANSPLSIIHSQLYLTRYRAYDAYTGRFLSSDPLGLGGSPNLYAYCLGNPLSYIDPLGLCGESLMWYDRTSDWLSGVTGTAKDYYNNALPWGLAGSLNTAIDLVTGIGHTPAAIGHLGEGTGTFSADPSWENVPGVLSDVLTVGSVLAATALTLPSVSGSGAVATKVTKSPGVKYIGKLDDLKGIPRSQTLLDDLPNLGSAKANYYQNSSVLRKALRDGYEIRDASVYRPNWSPDPTRLRPTRTIGQSFLGAERNIMSNKGFLLDSSGTYIPR